MRYIFLAAAIFAVMIVVVTSCVMELKWHVGMSPDNMRVYDANGRCVADTNVTEHLRKFDKVSHARMIASAPDMYAVLIDTMAAIEFADLTDAIGPELVKRIKDAIK